jgi:hypothetical protein
MASRSGRASLSRFRLALLAQSLYLGSLMQRFLCRIAALACLALAGAALPATALAEPPARLSAPRNGATLEAGSLAVLAWEPLSAFEELAQAEEWEAFLSLDGGARYPIRITPHLDRDLRRVLWLVPHTPTSDARLLLRFGDERRETAVELPERFAISAPGEPARPGDAGVVLWIEGSRRGGGLRQVIAGEASGLAAGRSLVPSSAWRIALETENPVPDPVPSLAGRLPRLPRLRQYAPAPPSRAAWPAPIPILLLTQRQNE